MMSNFRIVPGADGANPAKIAVYGTRNVNGVVLNVDKASRVKVQQEGAAAIISVWLTARMNLRWQTLKTHLP